MCLQCYSEKMLKGGKCEIDGYDIGLLKSSKPIMNKIFLNILKNNKEIEKIKSTTETNEEGVSLKKDIEDPYFGVNKHEHEDFSHPMCSKQKHKLKWINSIKRCSFHSRDPSSQVLGCFEDL